MKMKEKDLSWLSFYSLFGAWKIKLQKLPCMFDVASTDNEAPLDHGQFPDIT